MERLISRKMKIAITDIYGKLYEKDKLFDASTCKIGENLLVPIIKLKKSLEKNGHQFHTLDMYRWSEIDKIIFQEIPESIYTVETLDKKIKFGVKCILQKDYLFKSSRLLSERDRILLIMEPPAVAQKSYMKCYHKYFGKILTWDDDLVDNKKYFKFYYPQPIPQKRPYEKFQNKKEFVMISGNKVSSHPNELYSKRKNVVEYFETRNEQFDLYGFGWEKENYKNYRGIVDNKLDTLSKYKYSICFENQQKVKGYITEKIFDCFFANCIPIYWGAENISDYIPENTFIDWRKFSSIEDMLLYVRNIKEEEYNEYLNNIEKFLNSEEFKEKFSVDAYIKNMTKIIMDK